MWKGIFQFLGHLHPLVVHFPIGLLVVALFMEAFTIGGKRPGLREGIQWMVYLGALGALFATAFGWLLRTAEEYSGELVDYHQNLGFATLALAGITAMLLRTKQQGKLNNYLAYRIGLTLTVITLTIAGHLGASLTHGEDFLSFKIPDEQSNENTLALLSEINQSDSLSEEQLDELNMEVRAIFAHNCYQCHSENKKKGELVLENKRGVFEGGESGLVIVPGNKKESELYHRITLPSNHDDVMPKKGKVLKTHEINLIGKWIETGAHWSDRALKVFPEAELALTMPELPKANKDISHPVDKIVDAYFEEKNIKWTEPVEDRIFIRRAYLDIVGLLPEEIDITEFINSHDSNKRNKLIDNLLDDDRNYTQNWLSFWNDLLRNDYSGTGFITGGRKQITDWLYQSLYNDKPYNVMVKELVNPDASSEGFIKGIEWRGVVNASQRTEMQAAQNIGQSLLGMNVKCASCHNSFVSNLTLEQSYGFAAIFADSAMELNRCDIPLGKMAKVNFIYPELGSVDAASVKERLELLSKVIVKPENGRLYRAITNHIWKELMGRGIIEPVDVMDNIPWNSTLLDWLAADFIESGYDIKHLIRTIMTSKSYQLPSVNYDKIETIKSDKFEFHGPIIRRMSAEQFADAVSQVIAPVYYASAYDPTKENMPSSRIWHREVKFDRDVLPEPGKRYFRHVFSLSDKEILSANALISVDHSFTFYINGKKAAQGNDWRKVSKVDLTESLHEGENIIAIEGENEGTVANPAGILFALKIRYEGDTLMVQSDRNWVSTDSIPETGWIGLEFDDSKWKKVRNYGSSQWDHLVNFTFEENALEFARASLVRQHPFMKALGRPSRENVVTSRDEQATLLQSLELTNGDYFYNVLDEGAERWLNTYGNNTEKITDELYQKSMGRLPSKKEKDIILSAMGNSPDKEAVQDLFWTTLLLPEFQFIY